MIVVVNHNGGFFSCCSVKLDNIIEFINKNKRPPTMVDSSQQFNLYKKGPGDITYEYFEHYNNINQTKQVNLPIKYHNEDQFINYSDVDFKNIIPFIEKYFCPSNKILDIINNMEAKYKLNYEKYENICVLFYRGNDKIRETSLCSYDEYIKYADEVLKINPDIVFLIQSDESEFIDFISNKYPNSFYFKEEIRHMKKCNNTVDRVSYSGNHEFSKKYLAITIIMSKCKYIICGSGNCSIWIMFYRGGNKNVFQNLNGEWLINL